MVAGIQRLSRLISRYKRSVHDALSTMILKLKVLRRAIPKMRQALGVVGLTVLPAVEQAPDPLVLESQRLRGYFFTTCSKK